MSVDLRLWIFSHISFHIFLLALPTSVTFPEPRLGCSIVGPKELKAKVGNVNTHCNPKEGTKKKRCPMMCTLFPLCVISLASKMDKLQNIYYQPSHLWKGQKAFKKLQELSKEEPKVIKQWLSRQAFWYTHHL